jgi:fermentation-respiration switch protein FrsA (DUF1100 family)
VPEAKISDGVMEAFWLLGMQSSIIGANDCIKAFSETDQTEDLKKLDVPTLIVQGDADQIVPIDNLGRLTAKIGGARPFQCSHPSLSSCNPYLYRCSYPHFDQIYWTHYGPNNQSHADTGVRPDSDRANGN